CRKSTQFTRGGFVLIWTLMQRKGRFNEQPAACAAASVWGPLETETWLCEQGQRVDYGRRPEAAVHHRAQRQEGETGAAGLPDPGARGRGAGCVCNETSARRATVGG